MNTFRMLLAIIQTFYNNFSPEEVTNGVDILFIGSEYSDYKNLTVGANFSSLIGTPYYDIQKPTVVMIHGWLSEYANKQEFVPFVEAYTSRGHHNMIFIDWSFWGKDLDFFKVVSVMKPVTALISEIFRDMESQGFDLNKFHLVGHSLGGQMAGMIGSYFIENFDFTFSRITALDPAGVQFFNDPGPFGLIKGMPSINKSNAKFVDIIHTDADWNGMPEAEGHMDFYPNNGTRNQPGCTNECTLGGPCTPCSHQRALFFFFESVKHQTPLFIAKLCPNDIKFPNINNKTCNGNITASMGYFANMEPKTFGTYYLETNEESPYSK